MDNLTLLEACKIAQDCGLETVGEAIMNVELHYDAFFSIANLEEEERAFYEDVKRYNVTGDTPISEILNKESK